MLHQGIELRLEGLLVVELRRHHDQPVDRLAGHLDDAGELRLGERVGEVEEDHCLTPSIPVITSISFARSAADSALSRPLSSTTTSIRCAAASARLLSSSGV